jgi:hypothetical protein
MRRTLGWLAALSLPVLLLAGSAFAQKKGDKDADKDSDKGKPADKWVKAGVLTGKILAVYEDKRKMRVQVPIIVAKPNAGAANQYQQAQVSYAAAVARRDFNAARQHQREIVQAQQSMVTYESQNKEVEVQAQDDVVVRFANPKADYDDKGKLKKYTKAELKEMKGSDPKLPGYQAEFSDVQVEQVVQLTIVRKKGAPPPKTKAPKMPKKGKGKDKDLDVDNDPGLLEDPTPQVSMIVVVAEPPPGK